MRTYISHTTAIITGLLLLTQSYAKAQETYRTEIFRDDIKSLEVKIEGELFACPYIELNGEKRIEIRFDALHRTGGQFAYSIIHCNADWKKSALLPIEYMKGFQATTISDFANSMNTMTHYTHHLLHIPNENTQLTVSGNYAIQIYDEDHPQRPVLTACFSLVEPLIEIDATVDGNTDIDFNTAHQQVEFTLLTENLHIPYPQNDLKIFVYQNNNRTDLRTDLLPSAITNHQLQYRHNRKLIFEAGNEYRRIEFLSHRYNGMGIERIGFYNPYYHATLLREHKRTGYQYDRDQNGRFFVGCSDCRDPDTEADYYIVHFAFVSEPLLRGDLHISGDLFHNIADHRSRMEYNPQTGAYEKALFLKQGLYNYQYAFLEKDLPQASLTPTEGNFYETENEYTIAVYYRPPGARYDRLVGLKILADRDAQ